MKIAYFDSNGTLSEVSPRNNGTSLYDSRDIAYQADVFYIDGKRYDLSSATDILHIPLLSNKYSNDVTRDLSYIMKIRLGNVQDFMLIPVFVSKTLDLMLHSNIQWRMSDYLQVIRAYYRVGLFDEGDDYERLFRRNYPDLFIGPGKEKVEAEHISTKAYFKQKWEKKNREN